MVTSMLNKKLTNFKPEKDRITRLEQNLTIYDLDYDYEEFEKRPIYNIHSRIYTHKTFIKKHRLDKLALYAAMGGKIDKELPSYTMLIKTVNTPVSAINKSQSVLLPEGYKYQDYYGDYFENFSSDIEKMVLEGFLTKHFPTDHYIVSLKLKPEIQIPKIIEKVFLHFFLEKFGFKNERRYYSVARSESEIFISLLKNKDFFDFVNRNLKNKTFNFIDLEKKEILCDFFPPLPPNINVSNYEKKFLLNGKKEVIEKREAIRLLLQDWRLTEDVNFDLSKFYNSRIYELLNKIDEADKFISMTSDSFFTNFLMHGVATLYEDCSALIKVTHHTPLKTILYEDMALTEKLQTNPQFIAKGIPHLFDFEEEFEDFDKETNIKALIKKIDLLDREDGEEVIEYKDIITSLKIRSKEYDEIEFIDENKLGADKYDEDGKSEDEKSEDENDEDENEDDVYEKDEDYKFIFEQVDEEESLAQDKKLKKMAGVNKINVTFNLTVGKHDVELAVRESLDEFLHRMKLEKREVFEVKIAEPKKETL